MAVALENNRRALERPHLLPLHYEIRQAGSSQLSRIKLSILN